MLRHLLEPSYWRSPCTQCNQTTLYREALSPLKENLQQGAAIHQQHGQAPPPLNTRTCEISSGAILGRCWYDALKKASIHSGPGVNLSRLRPHTMLTLI